MEKKKWYKIGMLEKNMSDMDYLKVLDKKDKKWMMEFIDEYYNGTYISDRKKSKFYNPKFLKDLKANNIDEYNSFVKEFRQENMKRIKKGEKSLDLNEYFVIVRQREATKEKQRRKKDIFTGHLNMTNSSGDFKEFNSKVGTRAKNKQDKQVLDANLNVKFNDISNYDVDFIASEEKNDYELEQDKLLFCYKNNKIPLFICDKLIEMIDEKQFNSNEYKHNMLKNLNETKTIYNSGKLANYDFSFYLYKLFIIYKLIFAENSDVKIIENVFNTIVFPERMKALQKQYK